MTTEEIAARFDAIDRQNADLLADIVRPAFEGDIMLDPTLNKAQTFIHLANEAVVLFPQGAFPLDLAAPAIESTNVLLAACEKRYGRLAVRPMAQAFRTLENLWYYAGVPTHPPEIFRKKIFIAEEKLLTAICAFNREILSQSTKREPARAPKRKRKFGHEGNGLKGPKTKMMEKQKRIFETYLKSHPEDSEHSRISRAHQCWQQHPEWEKASKATGEAKGYANYKSLAQAK